MGTSSGPMYILYACMHHAPFVQSNNQRETSRSRSSRRYSRTCSSCGFHCGETAAKESRAFLYKNLSGTDPAKPENQALSASCGS